MLNPMVMQQVRTIKQAMNLIRSSGNPQAMMQQILTSNPNYGKLQELIRDNGGDTQKAFYAMAEKLGVDPNEIISALK